jgi:hypothetical protein
MSNITEMEEKLSRLDRLDADGGNDTDWRLKNRRHMEGPDMTKRDLEEKIEKELSVYGMAIPMLDGIDGSYTYKVPF